MIAPDLMRLATSIGTPQTLSRAECLISRLAVRPNESTLECDAAESQQGGEQSILRDYNCELQLSV